MKKETFENIALIAIVIWAGIIGVCFWGITRASEEEAAFERACRARGGIVKHPNHHMCVKDDTIPIP